MAKKVEGYIKLQIPAGKATPAPPVGPALGQHGINIAQFTKEFNAKTQGQDGMIIPVVITVYADRSFSFVCKTPPAAVLLKKGGAAKNRRDKDAGFECGQHRCRNQHDCRHGEKHGNNGRRLVGIYRKKRANVIWTLWEIECKIHTPDSLIPLGG